MKKTGIYQLKSENLTDLGWSKGSSFLNYIKYFSSKKKAADFAEAEYGKPIRWQKTNGFSTSGDLGHVMYEIQEIYLEK